MKRDKWHLSIAVLLIATLTIGCQPDYSGGEFHYFENDTHNIEIWVPDNVPHYSVDSFTIDYSGYRYLHLFKSGGKDSIKISNLILEISYKDDEWSMYLVDTVTLSISMQADKPDPSYYVPLDEKLFEHKVENWKEYDPEGFNLVDINKERIHGHDVWYYESSQPFDTLGRSHVLEFALEVDSFHYNFSYQYIGSNYPLIQDDAYKAMRSIQVKKK